MELLPLGRVWLLPRARRGQRGKEAELEAPVPSIFQAEVALLAVDSGAFCRNCLHGQV